MDGKPVDEASNILPEMENSSKDQDAQEKLKILEAKHKKMCDEFNIQRAKMKDLYVQKEAECSKLNEEVKRIKKELDEMKSQFVVAECESENERQLMDRKAQEEIASLQQLVQETIEESSYYKHELENVQEEFHKLRLENRELKEEQETPSLAPVLSHVKKTLARKLGGDSGGATHDSLDDSMRKVNKYAQEDAEVLRSLVVPLEEEIKALKEKLRATDEELQSYRQAACNDAQSEKQSLNATHQNDQNSDSVNRSTSMDHFQCDMCQNYEVKLVQSQKLFSEQKDKLERLQKSLENAREELDKEAALRRDLEDKWQEKREAHKEEVQFLTEQVKKAEKEIINIQQQFLNTKEEISRQLLRLTDDRERINKHLETLQSDNDFLSGKYLATSEEMENQLINLPNTVEELHELLLRQQNDLIQARVGCEFEKRKCVSYLDETQILRDQLQSSTDERRAFEKKIQSRTKSLEERLCGVLKKEQEYENMKGKYERKEAEMNKQISELRVQIIELQESNEKLEKANTELKSKMKILQDELATSEHVQKDFVKLSQSLQIALEKFRQADTQVRWEDDDDAEKCPNCKTNFTVTLRKHHCRHCGTIYCERCLTKTVPSGPRKRPARVCDICHTLLSPNKAPYFSHEAPQSPT